MRRKKDSRRDAISGVLLRKLDKLGCVLIMNRVYNKCDGKKIGVGIHLGQ